MATGRIERRLAAILAADVVGYSRLMERDEAGTFARLKAVRKEVVEPVLARHGGRFVGLKGDGAIVEFQSAVAAVEAAVEVQRAMLEQDVELPEDRRIRYRIGINLGEVIVDGDSIYGDGVNVAARIEALCEPGGVWLSRGVYNQVRGKLDLPLVPSGLHQVKNISEAVETFRVALDGVAPPAVPRPAVARARTARWLPYAAAALLAVVFAAGVWRFWLGEPPPNERPSIAVLPLDNLSGDERTGRFVDGITEDIITDLARFRYLDVIARNSVETYKGKAVDVRQVGKELGVRCVLEGSLQGDPERIRITVQLINAATGAHVWSERYDRTPALLFETRDEVTAQTAATLTGHTGPLAKAGEEVARRKPPGSLAAYEYLLLAGTAYGSRDKAGTAEARRLLEKALEVDPGYARAWTFLAWTHFDDALYGYTADREASWAAFHEAARRAAGLDPLDGASFLVLGMSHFVRGETALGAAAWDRALALSPNDTAVIRPIGTQLPIALGVERAQEGVELVERALRLDPFHPAWFAENLGCPLYFAGRYAEAAAEFEKVPDPGLEPRLYLAVSYAQAGEREKAAVQRAEVLKLDPGFTAEVWVERDLYEPGSSSAMLFFEGARKAGLPLCAPVAEVASVHPKNRLPECEAERAKVATGKS